MHTLTGQKSIKRETRFVWNSIWLIKSVFLLIKNSWGTADIVRIGKFELIKLPCL